MNTDQKYQLSSESSNQSLIIAETLGHIIGPGQVIELIGDLGGGKTTFVKGIAKGLGIDKTITSPSYNISRSYELPSGGSFEHFDLYRLNADEIIEAEISELINSDNIVAIEWAQHLNHQLAPDRLQIKFEYLGDNSRRISIHSTGPRSWSVIKKLQEKL